MDNMKPATPVTNPRLEFEQAVANFAITQVALKAAENEAELATRALFKARARNDEAGQEFRRTSHALVASMRPIAAAGPKA